MLVGACARMLLLFNCLLKHLITTISLSCYATLQTVFLICSPLLQLLTVFFLLLSNSGQASQRKRALFLLLQPYTPSEGPEYWEQSFCCWTHHFKDPLWTIASSSSFFLILLNDCFFFQTRSARLLTFIDYDLNFFPSSSPSPPPPSMIVFINV